MRIGIVCPYSFAAPGGVQTHVRGLARWLASQGHEVDVFAPGLWGGQQPVDVGFTSAGSSVPLPWNGSVARVGFTLGILARARRWLARGFDIVHVHEPVTPSVAYAVLALAREPVVTTHHCAGAASLPFRLGAVPVRRQLNQARAHLAVSDMAAMLARTYLQGPLTVVPNGVEIQPARTTKPRMRTVTFLGRDEPRKGLDVFLAAAAQVGPTLPGVRFVVAGAARGGPYVTVLGEISELRRASLLQHTDVLVASQLGGESFGLVLAEGLAAGAQVVASNLPAFREAFGEGAVRYFPPGDATALARSIVEALARPSQQDPRTVVRPYSWDVVGPQVLAAYGEPD